MQIGYLENSETVAILNGQRRHATDGPGNTILSQLLKLVPRHEFEILANAHHKGRMFRTASRWSQFVAMTMGQLSGRQSLRDIYDNVSAKQQRLYQLEVTKLSRSKWIALGVYLLIAYLKFQSKTTRSMQKLLRILQLNLFEKWALEDLIHGRPKEKIPTNLNQLSFLA